MATISEVTNRVVRYTYEFQGKTYFGHYFESGADKLFAVGDEVEIARSRTSYGYSMLTLDPNLQFFSINQPE